MDTEQRPFAVVTGASSGIGAGKVIRDSVKAEMHRKMAQPATAGERRER